MNFKIQPFVEKKISEIDPENDLNVCVLGRVIDIRDELIVLDDGSGKINILSTFKNLKVKDIIRVFGSVLSSPNGIEIKSEIIQDMNELDLELYKKISD